MGVGGGGGVGLEMKTVPPDSLWILPQAGLALT
jgi:hypothetical protein